MLYWFVVIRLLTNSVVEYSHVKVFLVCNRPRNRLTCQLAFQPAPSAVLHMPVGIYLSRSLGHKTHTCSCMLPSSLFHGNL